MLSHDFYPRFSMQKSRKRHSSNTTLPSGIISGETTSTSTVLWTCSTVTGNVCFEYATDPNFENIRGLITMMVSDPQMPVMVSLNYLVPATCYYYRITDAAGTVATGTFCTSSPTESLTDF